MNLKPCGYYVLVELRNVEQKSSGGIVLPSSLVDREQEGEPMGVVIDFGALAFQGWEGCDAKTAEGRAKQWGIEKGDMAIFNKYDGTMPLSITETEGNENYRFVPDKSFKGKMYE